jgi:hypothetical protein
MKGAPDQVTRIGLAPSNQEPEQRVQFLECSVKLARFYRFRLS